MSRLDEAQRRGRDTKRLELGPGTLARTGEIFREQFGDRAAVMIADPATFAAVAAGDLPSQLRCQPILLKEPHAEWAHVDGVEAQLRKGDAIPVAVGSGTINDLVKLASHRLGRPYLCVATAASMDGYTAYGASITRDGAKQTFDCPAPRAVVADIDVIRAAPAAMNAAGYADLLAKMTAGADWILADALGVEKIDPHAWEIVQGGLREALSNPVGIRTGDADAIARLTEGLLLSGFAMQAAQSSRPASGAEHQFSHLWEMQRDTDASHGFKVGVATLAVTRLYEWLLDQPIEKLDVDAAVARWPAWEEVERAIHELFPAEAICAAAIKETRAKYIAGGELRTQLSRLRDVWPDLSRRLRGQLLPAATAEKMLSDAGAPTRPERLGISPQRLRDSFRQAYHIRRRFTVLDLVERAALQP